MARVIIGEQENVYQVRAQWSGNGFGSGESRWSFVMPRASGDQRLTVLSLWETWLLAAFIEGREHAWRLDNVICEDRWPGVLAPLVNNVRRDADPPGEGPAMPPQCSTVISWRTGEISRMNRGRTYMGPYAADSMNGSFVTGPASEAVHDFGEAMLAHFTGAAAAGGPLFVIFSRVGASLPLSPGAFTPVTAFQTFEQWGVQRRRERFDWRS